MSGLTNYIKEGMADHLFCADLVGTELTRPLALYLACHTSAPDEDAPGLSEYLGGSYIRQLITFNQAETDDTGAYVSNRDSIIFSSMPNLTITHFAIWDAVTQGNMLSSGGVIAVNGSAVTSIPTGSGDTLTIAADILKVYI